jgi:flavin reductase (DIM6/NTAB) family NADH-FMN oxidoreductase RutF
MNIGCSTGALRERQLRNAFGMYPTGVTVVTCIAKDGKRIGLTANSFVSLSLTPPLVSIALHRAGRYVATFLESRSFSVNVLRSDQETLSNHFARPSACTWELVNHKLSGSGHLIIDDVSAYFVCDLVARYEAGDHILLVGEIQQYGLDENSLPLAFMRGRYGRFHPGRDLPPADATELGMCGAAPFGWG